MQNRPPLATLPLSRWPAVYTPHWVLAAPDVVIDPQMGVVGILKPDLAAVAHSSIDKECLLQARAQRGATRRNSAQFSDALPSPLLQFLLARSNAHDVVLDPGGCTPQEELSSSATLVECEALALSTTFFVDAIIEPEYTPDVLPDFEAMFTFGVPCEVVYPF